MSDHLPRPARFPALRRIWKPAVATGAGGAAAVFWFDEIVMFGADLAALIFLPIMAGALYLLDIFMFRARMPRREDIRETDKHGVKK